MLLNYIGWQNTAYARTQWHRVTFFVCLLKWDNSFKCLWLHWSNLFSNLRRHMTNILFFQLVGHTIVSNSFINHESIWEKIKAIHTYLAYFFSKYPWLYHEMYLWKWLRLDFISSINILKLKLKFSLFFIQTTWFRCEFMNLFFVPKISQINGRTYCFVSFFAYSTETLFRYTFVFYEKTRNIQKNWHDLQKLFDKPN